MAAIVRESTIRDATIGVAVPICANSAWAVIFLPVVAALTIQLAASVALRSDAHTVSDFYPFSSLAAYSDGNADNFVPDATWIQGLPLAVQRITGQLSFSSKIEVWSVQKEEGESVWLRIDAGLGLLTQPLRRVCMSEAQTPQCEIWMSTSVSSHSFGLKAWNSIGEVASVANQPWKRAPSLPIYPGLDYGNESKRADCIVYIVEASGAKREPDFFTVTSACDHNILSVVVCVFRA